MTQSATQSAALQQAAAPPPQQTSLIKKMANQYGLEPTTFKNTIVKTLFPSDKQNPTNEVVAAFLVVANQYNLNPFIKEIYAFPGKGGGIVPIVSIDGWNTIINRQPQYDGVEFSDEVVDGQLVSITAKIFRKDRSHPIMVTEYMSECKRGTEPWKQFPARMLRHKALIQAARYAFGLSGIYDPDEAERIAEATGNLAPEAAPVPIAVISEAQRGELVELAKSHSVVEKLGVIVEYCGFEMLAHITVDRYDDVVNAIKAAAAVPQQAEEEAIQGEVVHDEDPATESNGGKREAHTIDATIADDLDGETEDLRGYVQEMYESLGKTQQKDFIAGKTLIGSATKDELAKYKNDLEKLTA